MAKWLTNGLSKAEVRSILALLLCCAFIIFVFATVAWFPTKFDFVAGAIVAIVNVVVGYYFGSKTAQQGGE